MIDLNEKRQDIIAVATELFEKFVNMPKDVRPDDKERTGIQVLVWEPGTRNLVLITVKEPSEAARFFAVEKAVRMLANFDASSENSANLEHMKFPGGVATWRNAQTWNVNPIIASTSGLKAEEDVAISVAILAKITGVSYLKTCKSIVNENGILPEWYKAEDKGYFQFLFDQQKRR